MINLIKSYFVPKTAKIALVEGLLSNVNEFSCIVARDYPLPVRIWYRRQLHHYARQHRVGYLAPFHDVAGASETYERQKFLQKLYNDIT